MEKQESMQYAHAQIEKPTLSTRPRILSTSEIAQTSGGTEKLSAGEAPNQLIAQPKLRTVDAFGNSLDTVSVSGEPIIKPIPYTNIAS